METTIRNTHETRRICDERNDYGKLKVEGAIAHTTECADQKAPVSESSPNDAYPHNADDGTRAPANQPSKEVAAMEEENGSGLGHAALMGDALRVALDTPPKKTIKVDVQKYQAWLDDPALSDQQREQILGSLWQMILCFVDLGFGVSPLEDACGQVAESEGFCGDPAQDVVVCQDHTLSKKFNQMAAE
ncbi:hypothetical protein [Paracoccus denitrificans]|uniref:hypothetical protein n=1 Tax=Paracoccus denitrificans TaxID=266 RepID=UPI00336513DB